MSQDDGWQTVETKSQKKRTGQQNQQSTTNTSTKKNTNQKTGKSTQNSVSTIGKSNSGSSSSNTQNAQQNKPKNVFAKQLQKDQHKDSQIQKDKDSQKEKISETPLSQTQTNNISIESKKESRVKSISEYGWSDLKQLRRILVHFEAIANYSQGGIIGALRSKTIHNSEDRELDIVPISEIKINSYENAFMKYIADFVDVEPKRAQDIDILLGFMNILLSCIAHTRYYSEEKKEDNYWAYHEEFKYKVWNIEKIPTTAHESVYRELQEKLNAKSLAIDNSKLQLLLNGKGFDFRYNGNLSVPYIVNALKEFVNCNQSKTINQRRRLYRFEYKSGLGSRAFSAERAEWVAIAGTSKDYKTQVEKFEREFMNGDGAPVLGISSIDTLLHSIYTSYFKIKKRETPFELLNRIRTLLLAVPNLIDLPELLQSLNESGKWCGYENIQSHPDLTDYTELKKNIEAFLEREGVKKRDTSSDPINDTLKAIYEFNLIEESKVIEYKKFLQAESKKIVTKLTASLQRESTQPETESVSETISETIPSEENPEEENQNEENQSVSTQSEVKQTDEVQSESKLVEEITELESEPPQKGYPLSPFYLKEFLIKLQLNEEEVKNNEEIIRKISKLHGMTGILNTLKRTNRDTTKSSIEDEEKTTPLNNFDEFEQMEIDEE